MVLMQRRTKNRSTTLGATLLTRMRQRYGAASVFKDIYVQGLVE